MSGRLSPYLQREALIRSAFGLAERAPATRMTPQSIARQAGLTTRSIAQQFGDMDRFAAALQSMHYEETRQHTLGALYGLAPGMDRVLRAAQAYLDFAYTRRGLRAWLSELRVRSPLMQAQWRVDSQLYVQFVATELALCGWPHPMAGARLFIAAVLELVRHEQTEQRKLPAARRALEGFLRMHERPALMS